MAEGSTLRVRAGGAEGGASAPGTRARPGDAGGRAQTGSQVNTEFVAPRSVN